jgi:hypothetical protein
VHPLRLFSSAKTDFPQSDSSPLHALVIGIDHFASRKIKDLHGAVADADAVDVYLRTNLRTPAAQIVNLRNADATRARILAELRALATNPAIQRGDPVVIYFAAHGASALAPRSWHTSDGRIQLIVPHDCHMPDPETGLPILPIPDRTLGALLDRIAHSEKGKGDNIVRARPFRWLAVHIALIRR